MGLKGFRIEINSAGAREILRSPKVLAEMERRARAIAQAAGPGFEVEARLGANRARASVRAATFEARRAEAENRSLSRALEAGRG